jgi:hypothetical protein
LFFLTLTAAASAAGIGPGHLESVSILGAGAGSSVAVRTSSSAALVATTAADARTVVIELVGIAAERRDMTVTDGTGMISRIAIDTVRQAGNGTVTRIRVSLTRPFRRRVRISGNLVYVDFEPSEPNLMQAAAPTPATPAVPTLPRAKAIPAAASAKAPAATARAAAVAPPIAPPAKANAAAAPTTAISLLSRWLAVTEPLLHPVNPGSVPPVLGRAWIPVVLKDGTIIYSYGEYAQVEDQVTLLLPFDDSDTPAVEAVTLPRSAVDLDATGRASDSVRAARYIATRGPREFAELTQEVGATLNAVPSQPEPAGRVAMIESVRRKLIEWPATHYGYRALDVHDAISQLDPILIQFRAAAGVNRVDLSLVAPAVMAPPPMTFRQPTLIDLLENAMRLVSVMLVPAERSAVLLTTADSLHRHSAQLPALWFKTGQERVSAALKGAIQLDAAYKDLSADIVARATRAGAEGNVRAISALQSDLMERDRRLGGQRPDVIMSTMSILRTQYDVAAQAQLRREQKAISAEPIRAYATDVDAALKRFDGIKGDLQRFNRNAPDPGRMAVMRYELDFVKRALLKSSPPPEVAEAHSLLLTATDLALLAAQDSLDPRLPREVGNSVRASAASESLAMLDRGRRALETAQRSR